MRYDSSFEGIVEGWRYPGNTVAGSRPEKTFPPMLKVWPEFEGEGRRKVNPH